MTVHDLKNKKTAILGVGVEGLAVAEFLKKSGSQVTILDEKEEKKHDSEELLKIRKLDVPFFFGRDAFSNVSSYEIIFRSPGVKRSLKELQHAQKTGVVITSQTQLFFDLCPCPIIGVTGTKGKGTTSSLIYEMLKQQGIDAYLGGNIGTPPISFLDNLKTDSVTVLEMSSFQLQDIQSSPHIGVILMTTSEHLDYHKDVHEYVDAKRNIFRFQTKSDYAVVNKDYPASNESDVETEGTIYKVSREQEVEQGCFVKDNAIFLKMGEGEEKVIDIQSILLPGRHNLENVCAATMAALLGGAQMKAIAHVLKTFKGLEHRLELVKTFKGVRYYDDSFSTTPETAVAAIEAFAEPEILILGGSNKNSDFTSLGKVIDASENIKAIIGIGVEWERIKEKISSATLSKLQVFEDASNMHDIVTRASGVARLGDVVLLSPACASFGLFKNYKDRGSQFKSEVDKL